MKFWVLILLCLIQGLTEFLPVSSSGHLLLAEQVLGVSDNLLLLNLFLHLATLLAVVVVYRKTIWKLIKKPFQPLTYKLALATAITLIPATIYELCGLDAFMPKIYGFCFLITAALLTLTHLYQKKATKFYVGEVSYKSAAIAGAVQGLAVLPGISRSGSTISALILSGNGEAESAELSFLLSIPIILGGFVFELIKVDSFSNLFAQINPGYLVFGFLFTFFVSIFSLKLTAKLLKQNKFIFFAIYLIFIGIFAIIFNFI